MNLKLFICKYKDWWLVCCSYVFLYTIYVMCVYLSTQSWDKNHSWRILFTKKFWSASVLSCSPAPFCALCCVKLSVGEVQRQREQIKDRLNTQSGGQAWGRGKRLGENETDQLLLIYCTSGESKSCLGWWCRQLFLFSLQLWTAAWRGERSQTKLSAITYMYTLYSIFNSFLQLWYIAWPPAKLVKERQGSPVYWSIVNVIIGSHLLPTHGGKDR